MSSRHNEASAMRRKLKSRGVMSASASLISTKVDPQMKTTASRIRCAFMERDIGQD
jgi:hypothetical protein